MFIPNTHSRVIPYINTRAGFNMDITSGGYYERTHTGIFTVTPGIQVPISSSVDLNTGLGYMAIIDGDGNIGNSMVLKVGFGFHKGTDKIGKPKKPKADTRDKGLQYELGYIHAIRSGELVMFDGYQGGLSYKMNPNISFGIGLEYGSRIFGGYSYEEKHHDWSETKYGQAGKKSLAAFLRGRYRVSNKAVSPIAGVDLGYAMFLGDFEEHVKTSGTKKNYMFVIPNLGFSFRIAPNSYLDLTVGYQFANKTSDDDSSSYTALADKGFTATLTFVHTLKCLSK